MKVATLLVGVGWSLIGAGLVFGIITDQATLQKLEGVILFGFGITMLLGILEK